MFISKIKSIIPKTISSTKRIPQKTNTIKDMAEFAGAKINATERNLMEEVRKYSLEKNVETARLMDKKGRLCNIDTIESANNVSVMSKDSIKLFGHDFGIMGKILKTALMSRKGTYIHSHTMNMPLSGTDIVYMVNGNIKKMLATNPNGDFSYLEMPKHSKIAIHTKKYFNAAQELSLKQFKKIQELGIDFEDIQYAKNHQSEKIKEYSNFSSDLIQDFANKFGFEFKKGKL